jgi:7-keto-8-aminopelargonate synthetase-like enzyme
VILRADLPTGVKVAQTIHAAGESSPGNLPASTHAVALEVRDEQQLQDLEQALVRAGINFRSIREPDAPYSNALVAIGIEPQVRSPLLRKLLGRFPLVK